MSEESEFEQIRMSDEAIEFLEHIEFLRKCVIMACGVPSRIFPIPYAQSLVVATRRLLDFIEGGEIVGTFEGDCFHRTEEFNATVKVLTVEVERVEEFLRGD